MKTLIPKPDLSLLVWEWGFEPHNIKWNLNEILMKSLGIGLYRWIWRTTRRYTIIFDFIQYLTISHEFEQL